MRVLLDENLPHDLILELSDHQVVTVQGLGWAGVKNGELLRLAATRFDVLLTVDRNFEYQQNFSGVAIAVIVVDVSSNDIAALRPLIPAVVEALPKAKHGAVTHVRGLGRTSGS